MGKMVVLFQEKEVDGQSFDQNSDFVDEACCVEGVVVLAEFCYRSEAASDCRLQGYHQNGKSCNVPGMAYVVQSYEDGARRLQVNFQMANAQRGKGL